MSSIDSATNMRLVVVLVQHGQSFEAVINSVLDAGISDAAVADSQSLGSIMRRDMPIFAGLAALLPRAEGSRLITCLVPKEAASRLMTYLRELPKDDRPIAAVLPVEQSLGLES